VGCCQLGGFRCDACEVGKGLPGLSLRQSVRGGRLRGGWPRLAKSWIVKGVMVGFVPLILTVEPSGGAVPAMLDWRKPTVVKIALPIPIALTIAVAMMNEV
jgi:hypothetical protein